MKIIFFAFLLVSCSHQKVETVKGGRVTIIKQWPLSHKVNTLNVELAMKVPEFTNQKAIYDLILSRDKATLIAEGCEHGTVIDARFASTFNGWNFSGLEVMRERPHYADIITHLPLKLKVKSPDKIEAVCGDSEDLMAKSKLALSEARGYIGFFYRMDRAQNDPAKFKSYWKALEETEKRRIRDPLKHTERKALENVASFWKFMHRRNEFLVAEAKSRLQEGPFIIVNGFHVKDLEKKFKDSGVEVEVLTPDGYPEASENMGEELTKMLKR